MRAQAVWERARRRLALRRSPAAPARLLTLACCVAMTGKECVAIACDLRFGVQNQTNATDMTKVFKIHDQLYCGLAGLATDMMTLCVRASAPRRRVAVPRRRTD